MKIRKATLKDIPEIKQLNKFGQILARCTIMNHLDKKYTTKNIEKSYYYKYIQGRNKWCYVAEEKNKLIGFILFEIAKRELFWKIKNVGYVDLIFIDKKFRKKGLGKLLINQASTILKQKGIDYLKLSCQTKNKPALEVWKKLGFKNFRVDLYKKLT